MVSKVQYEKIALSFAGVEKGTSYGKPAFLVAGKFFTRLREEDASVVLFVESFDEREMLLAVEPEIFHLTAHYKDYPIVLARLAKLDANMLRGLLQRGWRRNASKKLLRDAAAAPAGASKSTAGSKGARKARTA